MNKPPLRKLLALDDVGNVDALLRRIEHLLSCSSGLTNEEKKDVLQGGQALRNLFYDFDDRTSLQKLKDKAFSNPDVISEYTKLL